MKVLVTGHEGYVGAVMIPLLHEAGHDVVGLDTGYYKRCDFGPAPVSVPSIDRDLRDIQKSDLEGFEAVIHLGALSNDPVGDLHAGTTYAINRDASTQLATLAKAAGVSRFLFSSSCSLYGAGGTAHLTEEAAFNPITPYGESKILVEQDLAGLADDSFTPVYLRNATAYGSSPRLRLDIVVNNLTACAFATGKVHMMSDGSPWRPLVHVEDMSRAFVAVLTAPQDVVHDQAFNVGRTEENYQVREVGELVQQAVEGSEVTFADNASVDIRDYRVSFDKIADAIPSFKPQWTVPKGIDQLYSHFQEYGMPEDVRVGSSYTRLLKLKEHMDAGLLDDELRWKAS